MLFSCLMRFIFEKIQYQDGQLVGADNEVNLFKGVMTFMINSLKKYVPFVIKAIPEIKIEGKWLSEHLDNGITSLNSVGFNVCAVISDNHSTNILSLTCMEMSRKVKTLLITHPIQPTIYIYIYILILCTYWKTFVTIYLTHGDLFFHLLNLISFSILLMYLGEK